MYRYFSIVVIGLMLAGVAHAGESMEASSVPKGLKGVTIGGVYYLHYQNGESSSQTYNKFKVSRAYLTVKKKILPFLSSRITMDISQDDTGDIKVRAKYAYAHFKFQDMGFITNPNLELGLVHMPWLDFEEHINYYRMQGHMFMEESHLFNSADFGFTLGGYFGGELDDEYKKTVNKKYAGRFGSFAVGAYNGGGYHAKEKNENKTIESRLTVRPLPDIIPGAQISYFGIFGKGNQAPDSTDENPDWMLTAIMFSYEHRYLTLTGQFIAGDGNQKGTFAETTSNANGDILTRTSNSIQGMSLFGEGKLGSNWRVIGRFDSFDENTDVDDDEHTRIIVGAGYDFGHHNILIADYQIIDYAASDIDNDTRLQVTMQIHY